MITRKLFISLLKVRLPRFTLATTESVRELLLLLFDNKEDKDSIVIPNIEYYTNENPTPITIGGIDLGDTFVNQTQTQMWDKLLYPYLYPAFSTFTINSQPSTVEVGETLGTNKTFIWTTINPTNILDSKVNIHDLTNDIDLVIGTSNDGSQVIDYGSIIKTTETYHEFMMDATNTNDDIFSILYRVYWKYKLFYGNVTVIPTTSSNIRALSSNTFDTNTLSINITSNKYIIAIPNTKNISMVITSRYEDITSNFVLQSPINIVLPDNTTTKSYKIYLLETALPLDVTATVTLT